MTEIGVHDSPLCGSLGLRGSFKGFVLRNSLLRTSSGGASSVPKFTKDLTTKNLTKKFFRTPIATSAIW